jgi:quercetin dioxygenase-like cupin family protein
MRWGGRPIWCLSIVGALLTGTGLGVMGDRLFAALPVAETFLLRTDLAGVDKHELIVSRLEAAPGWSHGRHYHIGHEIVYVLEGSAALDVDGKPERLLQPGTVSYVPPRQVHAGRNPSRTAALKFLLIRIHVKGEPISVELN